MICAQAMVLIGEMWSKLPEAQKSAYQNRAAKSREKYQAALVRARRLNMVVFTWERS